MRAGIFPARIFVKRLDAGSYKSAAKAFYIIISMNSSIFTAGPVSPQFVAQSIESHSAKTSIGGHGIFLGQVRADELDGKTVAAIEYSAYEDLAAQKMHDIREDIFARRNIICMHVLHSLGVVPAGKLCLFVFVSSRRRREAFAACEEAVERIKAELPVWGREIFADDTHRWKVNP